MRKKQSQSLFDGFSKQLQKLGDTRRNFESCFGKGELTNFDMAHAYAGLYLNMITAFENLLESLFLGILNNSIKHSDLSVRRQIKIMPKEKSEEVLIGTKGSYLDWLPYTQYALPRAKIYLVQGKPFSNLSDAQKNTLSNNHKIRNALVHKSKKAQNEFQTALIAGKTLLSYEKTPDGYLRSIPNPSTAKTQLELISEGLLEIANQLC